ncbi:MAG: TetR/AcrR family transcriptional regulator [Nanoarchaeota archaeon]|nr:MAG: TetR/AcrR family transcriptional regulator [Nanoarchaeota archaeon]
MSVFIMKRKTYNVQFKREGKKNEIIQAAVQLFIEKGFDKVSLADIASKINLGRTTIYEYFNNKSEILSLYLEKEMLEYHKKVMAIVDKKTVLRDKLMEFIKLQLEYGSYHKSFSQLFRSLSRSSGDISGKTEAAIRGKHQEIYVSLMNEFNAAIRQKEIRDLPSDILMQLLINATSFPVRSKKEPTQTAEEVFSIFWSGISNINF